MIPPGDQRNWIFQYNSGVFFQQDLIGPNPTSIEIYVYTGGLLSDNELISSYSNIRVTGTGSDIYTGYATPSIATYSINHMYLVDFEYTNTGPTVSLNIDGLGPYDIIKFDGFGNPIGLTAGEINVGQIYYVLWDGINFQLNVSNPESVGPNTYTNLVGSVEVGGIPSGMTFSNVDISDVIDILLTPQSQQSNFTTFSFNNGGYIREVGNDIPEGTYSFTWNTSFPGNVQTDSISISDYTLSLDLVVGTSNDGESTLTLGTVSYVVPGRHEWRISANRITNNTVISNIIGVDWHWKRYHGTHSSSTLTESDILTLNSVITDYNLDNYQFGSGYYKFFAWPTSYNIPSRFIDFGTNISVLMAGVEQGYTYSVGNYYAQSVSVTNMYGYTTDYYVFRTLNILGGTINIMVT